MIFGDRRKMTIPRINPDFAKQNPPKGPPGKISKRFFLFGGVIPIFCMHFFMHIFCVHAKFGIKAYSTKIMSI
jgi:hypothetical protein